MRKKTHSTAMPVLSLSRFNTTRLFIKALILALACSPIILATPATGLAVGIEPENSAVMEPGVTTNNANPSDRSDGQLKTAAANCSAGTIMNIVAHEDDDILFLSPDLIHNIQTANVCVTTIYVTAGDADLGTKYMLSREAGSQAAYSQMAGKNNAWNYVPLNIADSSGGNHFIAAYTLIDAINITLIYMRLPDGGDGSGYPGNSFMSLKKLRLNSISSITTLSGDTYTDAALGDVLTKLMVMFQPTHINTQDWEGSYRDGDHSDHHAVAYYVKNSAQSYGTPHTITSYLDYLVKCHPANVTGSDLMAKYSAWSAYASNDNQVCQTFATCQSDENYGNWLQRQYISAPTYCSLPSRVLERLARFLPGGKEARKCGRLRWCSGWKN